MDGLLVDSEPLWYDVETALVARLGGMWSRSHQAVCIGGTLDATCRYIAALTGTSATVDELVTTVLADMAAHFAEALPLHAGALELIDAVRDRGVATGLVSSSYRVLVDAALMALGPHRFDVTVAGDEVSRGKPDPEPYLAACTRLGVRPLRTVVLEDAWHGVQSAEGAGCKVVVVPSVAPVPATSARPVVAALTDVDPDWLVGLPGLAALPAQAAGAVGSSGAGSGGGVPP